MNRCIVGIDPGLTGGWAVLTQAGAIIDVGDLPVVGDGARRALSAPLLAAIISRHVPSTAIIERVGAMPGQGVSSTFKFGHAAGLIEGVLGAMAVPVMHVAPAVWKRHHGLGSGVIRSAIIFLPDDPIIGLECRGQFFLSLGFRFRFDRPARLQDAAPPGHTRPLISLGL